MTPSDPQPAHPDNWLAAVRARLEAATPGPWLYADLSDRGGWHGIFCAGFGGNANATAPIVVGEAGMRLFVRDDDGELMAHAPADLRRALDEVGRLRRELETRAAYGRLLSQLCALRLDGSDEDEVLDHLDAAWWAMTVAGRASFEWSVAGEAP